MILVDYMEQGSKFQNAGTDGNGDGGSNAMENVDPAGATVVNTASTRQSTGIIVTSGKKPRRTQGVETQV